MKRTWIIILIGTMVLCAGAILALAGLTVVRRSLAPANQADLAQPQIYAYRDWQSVGVQVDPGDYVRIRASGEWLYTPGEYHGPGGHAQYRAPDTYPVNAAPGGVLLGRIGEDGPIFVVGRGGTFVADRAGFLYLRINDDILGDNEGFVTVEVTVDSPSQD